MTNKKGFQLPEKLAILDFEETDYEGAEVKCRLNVPLRTLLDLQRLSESQDAGEIQSAFEAFGKQVLVEWNLLDQAGKKIPANEEGMLAIDAMFAQELITQWVRAVSQPSNPLEQQSTNGKQSGEESTLTEASSLGLGNSSRPR